MASRSDGPRPRFGVLLNMGAALAATPEAVFDFTLDQVDAAEQLGYAELWVTEHHFIRFGINPSALTAAAFLLGRTSRIRVGTAVVLSPLCHPIELAERAALLDQLSVGRLELGLGRGGYRRDYEIFGTDFARWDVEPHRSAQRIIDSWLAEADTASAPSDAIDLQPRPRSQPHPNLLLATSSEPGIAFAARHGLALQHYFATPVAQRVQVENRHRELCGESTTGPDHLHTLIVIVDGTAGRRDQLAGALRVSFRDGDHEKVPQASSRHHGPGSKPMSPDAMADYVAENAIVGSPAQVVDELGRFVESTGAQRIAVFHEAINDSAVSMKSLENFALLVAPQLAA